MSSVYKRIRPRPGKPDLVTWEARWREPDNQRQRKRAFTKKTDAERFLTSVEASLLTGGYVSPERSKITLGEFAEMWLAGRTRLKPKTVAGYRSLLDNRVLPRWGEARLDRITYEAVRSWVAETAAEVSPSTTRQAYFVLTSILDEAVKGHRLATNPARGVELPRQHRTERRYLASHEVDALAAACGREGLVVLMLAYTGLRWGELAALRVGRVSSGARTLHIAEAMTEVQGVAVYGPPKTHADRYVGVPTKLRPALLALIAGKRSDALVFESPRGGVMRVNNFRRRCFDAAAKQVGLEGLVPHELRHTAASLAISSGADVKAVQNMLGHASAAMTLDRYSHLFPNSVESLAERMDAFLTDSSVPPMCPQDDSSSQ